MKNNKLENMINVIKNEGLKQIVGGESEPICQRTPKPEDPNLTNCVETWSKTYTNGEYCGLDSGWSCEDDTLASNASK